MTGKRFKKLVSSIDYYDLWDTVEDKGYVAEDLANALYEENEQLRKDVVRYRGNFREIEDVKCELAEENEQLKSFIKKLTNRNGEILLMNGYGYTKSYVEKLLNEKELEE